MSFIMYILGFLLSLWWESMLASLCREHRRTLAAASLRLNVQEYVPLLRFFFLQQSCCTGNSCEKDDGSHMIRSFLEVLKNFGRSQYLWQVVHASWFGAKRALKNSMSSLGFEVPFNQRAGCVRPDRQTHEGWRCKEEHEQENGGDDDRCVPVWVW